jgi:hypothetical protein
VLAPTRCRSRDQCFRMTRDVAATVRIMVDNLADPALLDPAVVRLWLDPPDLRASSTPTGPVAALGNREPDPGRR